MRLLSTYWITICMSMAAESRLVSAIVFANSKIISSNKVEKRQIIDNIKSYFCYRLKTIQMRWKLEVLLLLRLFESPVTVGSNPALRVRFDSHWFQCELPLTLIQKCSQHFYVGLLYFYSQLCTGNINIYS